MNELRRNSSFYLLALGLYLACVFVVSHFPAVFLGRLGLNFWDKAAHCVEYVPVGFLLCAGIGLKIRRVRIAVALVIVFAVLLAGLDELHQSFIPGRDADPLDALADILGTVLGAAVAFVMFLKEPAKKTRSVAGGSGEPLGKLDPEKGE